MSYANMTATKLIATRCVACDRPLLDSLSVTWGMGPTCRKRAGISPTMPHRELANQLVHAAAIAAENGRTADVVDKAQRLHHLGLAKLHDILIKRFVKITLQEETDSDGAVWVHVYTPFDPTFLDALRTHVPAHGQLADGTEVAVKVKVTDPNKLNGRGQPRFKCWKVRRGFCRSLLRALAQTWPGRQALGPRGVFQVPTVPEYDHKYAKSA